MHININESQSKGKFGNSIRNCGIQDEKGKDGNNFKMPKNR